MKKAKGVLSFLWMLSVMLLYFFESAPVTRVLAVFSFVLLVGSLVQWLWQAGVRKREKRKPIQEKEPAREVEPILSAVGEGYRYSDSRPGNDPSVTYGIREYVPGDPVRNIHWKLSEKTEKIMIREFGQPLPDVVETPLKPETESKTAEPVLADTRLGLILTNALYLLLMVASILLLCRLAGVRNWNIVPLILGAFVNIVLQLLRKHPKQLLFVVLGILAIEGGMLYFIAGARAGVVTVINGIMYQSEQVNRYRYVALAMPESSMSMTFSVIFFLSMLAIALAAVLTLVRERTSLERCAVLAMTALFVALMCYFGIGGNEPVLLVFFAAELLLLVYTQIKHQPVKQSIFLAKKKAPVLFFVFFMTALCLTVFAGKMQQLEEKLEHASEQVRDRLEPVDSDYLEKLEQDPERQSVYGIKQESLLREWDNKTPETTEGLTEYQREIEEEHRISMPNFETKSSLLKGIGMAVASLLLLILPFLPFYILERVKTKIRKRREAFAAEDAGAAIRAMFPQLMECVCELRQIEETDYETIVSSCRSSIGESEENDWSDRLLQALVIWQEAEYSEHKTSREQKELVEQLLADTEAQLKEKLGFFRKIQLGIID